MFDLTRIGSYRESNRLEAKLATGGLPESLWETYSSFANTHGGVILLGVEELPDKSLQVRGLLNPEEMLEEFLSLVSDPRYVSVNLLHEDSAWVEQTDAGRIVVIEVPKANAQQRPVYVGASPYSGTYRRDGDGDFHCTRAEVDTMLRKRGNVKKRPGL